MLLTTQFTNIQLKGSKDYTISKEIRSCLLSEHTFNYTNGYTKKINITPGYKKEFSIIAL